MRADHSTPPGTNQYLFNTEDKEIASASEARRRGETESYNHRALAYPQPANEMGAMDLSRMKGSGST